MRESYNKDVVAKFSKGGEGRTAPTGKSMELELPFDAVEGKEEECKAVLESFGTREVTVDHKKIRGDLLFEIAEWSVAELIALEPLVIEHVLPAEAP